ncbi:MAG: hypothetical protein AVDCRST_MAG59-2952 [uncultured Thermomicrobiales bacterium]|uniref:Uncharacterized protein n=1 Tax=uncultured Thermomicrobiales bacterium TaxID=1645740 RepID=A0A6J4V1D5_9BACT|nr:MAG: hypothetical protein AVDCRST_MAG59-2952 [uncultured Thermomicrobiales bacterium]
MRRLLAPVAGGLLLAASTPGLGPTIAVGGDVWDTALPGTLLPRRYLPVAQTPGTNPPDRDECRKLAAAAQVRELDDGERDRLGLCLATRRDGPGPASEADPLGRERQG